MSWTCPKCSRKFSTERLYHSCEVVSMDDHVAKCNLEIKDLVDEIIKLVMKWKNVQVTPLKSFILISAGTNCMSLKPRKQSIEIEFILNEEINEFPIYKTMKYGKKFVHYVKMDSKENLNPQLINWLKTAHKTALNRSLPR